MLKLLPGKDAKVLWRKRGVPQAPRTEPAFRRAVVRAKLPPHRDPKKVVFP